MQASWGAENSAPIPTRAGELYGEKGRWIVDNMESVSDVFTRAEPGVRGADDAATKFKVKEYVHNGPVQHQSTKKPAEMDLQANGLHNGGFSTPDFMTMADHDKGLIWPPPKGHEHKHSKFMGMVKEPSLRSDEVHGIMIGYKGHVPRARDKVGTCPIGNLPNARGANGFPAPEDVAPDMLPGYGSQSSKAAEYDIYTSTSHAVQFNTAKAVARQTDGKPTKLESWNERDGYIPRYAGHMPKAIGQIGGSVYGGNPAIQRP